MANVALREAISAAHLSQDGFAREIQRAGWRRGSPNGCTREMVYRWVSGRTRRPQPRYLLLIEDVLGQPAGSLGFDADLGYGMDRAQAMAEAGLDQVFPLPGTPDPGGMSGIWRSSYSFTSSGRNAGYTSRHFVLVLQYGARLMARSLPRQASAVSMDLSVNGRVITGTWTERTRGDGYYRGALYTGAVQMLEDEAQPGQAMAGRWVGFGKDGEINDGPWSLDLAEASMTPEAAERWDRALPAELQSGSAA